MCSCRFWFGLIPLFQFHALITQSHIWFYLRKNSKVLEKHQNVTSKHIDQSKTQNTMDNFLFQKQNPILACSRRMAQIQKKKKWQPRSGKRGFSEDTFHIILTIAKQIPQNQKGKILTRCVS